MDDPTFVAEIAEAVASHSALPEFNTELSLARAYELQHEVTKIRTSGAVGGIKAGVTAAMAQKFLQLDHALIASLYADSRLGNGDSFEAIPGRAIECEVAVGTNGHGEPLWIAPAIEIVLVNFARQSDMNAANLVASNLGADLFLVGDPVPWDEEFNDVTATLTSGDQVLNNAAMTDALGGPVPGVGWMWAEAAKRGFELGRETLFMMGACGNVVPANEGHYLADYGKLGRIEFDVTPVA